MTPMAARRPTVPAEPQPPRLEIRHLPTDSLVHYASNPRRNDPAVDRLVPLLREFGLRAPLLVHEVDGRTEVVDGHLRLKAATKIGLAEVPVVDVSDLSEAQVKALRLAMNKSAEFAEWDDELLAQELRAIEALGMGLDLTGFGDEELARLLNAGSEGLTDPDEVPDPPADPVSRLGDVWLLGRHRLACGDSTDPAVIDALMQGDFADLCFTSPPYGQQRDYKNPISDWLALMKGVFAAAPLTEPAQMLVNLGLVHHDGEWLPYWDPWLAWMREQQWRTFGWYVWDQGPGMAGDWNGRLAPSHEFIFHFNRIAERARKTKAKMPENIKVADKRRGGMRRKDGSISGRSNVEASLSAKKIPDSVIRVMRHKARGIERAHPAVFPVELAVEIIAAFSDPGDIVYEPFCGSGSQIIAAEKTGRDCHAVDLAAEYVDVSVRRWMAFTGEQATHEQTGRTFAELAADRGVVLPARPLAGAA